MRLLTKFNLLLLLVFGLGAAGVAYVARGFLHDNAREQVVQEARLMMQSSLAARTYTSKQVNPLLQRQQLKAKEFLPQTVSAYAAAEAFNYLRKEYPDYTYKEAALNPTNLRDKAVDWEADIIYTFRNHPDRKEVVGERDAPTGRTLFLARPITVGKACLECHSTPAVAPPAMLKAYNSTNGFGWKEGEIVAAQIVSVPMTRSEQMANLAFQKLMASLMGLFGGTMLVLTMALLFMVIRPLTRLAATANQISKGDMSAPELPSRGRDEIAQLAGAFNRMYMSIKKAMRMLETSEIA